MEFLKSKDIYFSNKFTIIFYLAILSSQSTGGYLYLFLHILFFNPFIQNNKKLLYPLFLIFSFLLFLNIPFLGSKFSGFISDSSNMNDYHYYNGRLNFSYMISLFAQNPFFWHRFKISGA